MISTATLRLYGALPLFCHATLSCGEHALASRDGKPGLPVLPLRIVEPPFSSLPKLPIGLVWHDRTHDDGGGRFFRQLVLEALRDKPPARSSAKRGG